MRNYKKILSVLLAATVAVTPIVGCGNTIDSSAKIMTIGDQEVEAGVVNFYARYQQAIYETYYMIYMGEDMWTSDIGEGVTYEESTKESIINTIQELYVMGQHAADYEVELSEEELEAIEMAAEDFMSSNKNSDANELVSATKENVVEILSLITLQNKMEEAIKADIDTDVTDEESIQKKMTVVSYDFSHYDEDGNLTIASDEEKMLMLESISDLEKTSEKSEDLLAEANTLGLVVEEVTFDQFSFAVDSTIISSADQLKVGEFTGIIETDAGYYLAQLTSLNDKTATETKVNDILTQRENDLYTETLEAWMEDANISVYDSVLKDIDFQKLGVTMYIEEVEEVIEDIQVIGTNEDGEEIVIDASELTQEVEEE